MTDDAFGCGSAALRLCSEFIVVQLTPMNSRFSIGICLIAALFQSVSTFPQTGGGHTLFGDLRVDESKVPGLKPQVYYITLSSTGSSIGPRQAISSNGRYRFLDVRNGEYDLIIEVDARQIERIHLIINEMVRTDIRRDLYLEWKPEFEAKAAQKAGTISAGELYIRPGSNKARFTRALEQMQKRDYGQAVRLLSEIVESDPHDFEALTELGTAHFNQNQPSEAASRYLKALAEHAAYLPALLNLAKLRLSEKNYDGAIETLTLAVQSHPTSADSNFLLGESYLQAKKGSKAVIYLNEALRLDPIGKADAHLRLAALYKAARMKDKAVEEYERFLVKRPDYPEKEKLQAYIAENKK
ncbi:MAG TPA: tetratricopeptide repeat protein [Acidobacteriota bacterium]|jgi:tetratricopeptide (TPR) repeat protein